MSHGFIRRDTLDAASLTKKVLAGPAGDTDQFKETRTRSSAGYDLPQEVLVGDLVHRAAGEAGTMEGRAAGDRVGHPHNDRAAFCLQAH